MRPIDLMGLGPDRSAVRNENGWLVTVTPKPIWGLPPASLQLTEDQYIRYLDWTLRNDLIQNCLPDLSIADCEILMTGIAPDNTVWNAQGDEDEGTRKES